MRLNKQERESLRKSIKNFFVKNPKLKNADAVKHFEKEGVARRTIYNNLNKLANEGTIHDKKHTGRSSSWNQKKLKKLKRLTNNKKGVNQVKLGRQFSCHQSTISRKLRLINVKARKREKAPKTTPQQQDKARKRRRKLVNILYRENPSIIIVDEKYFYFSNDSMPSNNIYYSDDKE